MIPSHMKPVLITICAVLALAAVVVAAPIVWLAWMDPFDGPRHPSDAVLLAQFHTHRPALEELVAMLGSDPEIERLAPEFTRPEPPPLTPARLADYRQRLAAAGIDHGLTRYGDEIVFLVSTRGLAIAGSGKGIAHCAQPASDAVVVDGDFDDAAAALAGKDRLLVRHIDGDWWLLLDMR